MNIEQERMDFEASASKHGLCTTLDDGFYRSHVARWMWRAWQERAALQEQDLSIVLDALEAAQGNIAAHRPVGSSDPGSDRYDHDAFMWDFYQKAIDHARRLGNSNG